MKDTAAQWAENNLCPSFMVHLLYWGHRKNYQERKISSGNSPSTSSYSQRVAPAGSTWRIPSRASRKPLLACQEMLGMGDIGFHMGAQ